MKTIVMIKSESRLSLNNFNIFIREIIILYSEDTRNISTEL